MENNSHHFSKQTEASNILLHVSNFVHWIMSGSGLGSRLENPFDSSFKKSQILIWRRERVSIPLRNSPSPHCALRIPQFKHDIHIMNNVENVCHHISGKADKSKQLTSQQRVSMAALTILASFTEQQKPPTVNKQRIPYFHFRALSNRVSTSWRKVLLSPVSLYNTQLCTKSQQPSFLNGSLTLVQSSEMCL